jgi:outer membrane cobalamin receptor
MDFLNPQARYAVHGNADLVPEHSWNLSGEVGATGEATRIYVRGFANQLRDFIETKLVADSAGISLFEYQNVGRARTAGAELGGSLTQGVIEARGSYAYLDTEDESTGSELLGRAAHTARVAVTAGLDRLSVRSELIYTSRVPLSRSAGTTRYQDAYSRLNLLLTAAPLTAFQITVGVDNVGDTVPGGAIGELGRRWFAGLNWGTAW